jgi:membrane protease YdiL (CAAX protease family)
VVAGLFEEMLFRGFLQNSLEQYGDVTRAILWTALLFATFHMNPWWLAQIVLLGVILGVLAWKSDSIIPGAIVHAINNGLSVVIINTDESRLEILVWRGHVHPFLVLAALAVLVFSLRLFYQFCDAEAKPPTLIDTP